MPKWPQIRFIPARPNPPRNNKAGLEVPHDAAGLQMTKFFTASRWHCSSAAFTRTRHETMMTTMDLTVVEQYNEDDRQSPRTQSADTRSLPLDCSRLPVTMERLSNSGFDKRVLVSTQVAPENTANDRPPTSENQTRVPLNSAQLGPLQLGLPSRLHRLKVRYILSCLSGQFTNCHYKTETFCWNHFRDADWLISSHMCCYDQSTAVYIITIKRLLVSFRQQLVPTSNSVL